MQGSIKRVILIVAGMLCSLGVVYALVQYINLHNRLEKVDFVRNLTNIILAQAESTLNEASNAVMAVRNKRITSCSAADIQMLSTLAFTHPSIYEIGLFNTKGALFCSNLGRGEKKHKKSGNVTRLDGQVSYAMMPSLMPGKNAMIMDWENPDGGGVRVIIAPKALYDGFLQKDLYKYGHASVKLSDGTLINEDGALWRNYAPEKGNKVISLNYPSVRYPLNVTVEILSSVLPGNPFAFNFLVYLGGAVFTLLVGVIISNQTRRDTNLRSEINTAIRRQEFVPYYQPIINTRTGAVAGCEVLLRWQKPDGKLISPKLFVPYAEMNGQIIEITRNLMMSVRDEMAEFQKHNAGFFYSINLTAQHFASNEVLDDIREIFSDSIINPYNLIFEITERQPLHDINTASMIIDGLQSLGAKVAIDDAGTGHGGLAYIQKLGIDKIKIDKMFVEAIDNNSPGAPIVDALIHMSRELNISVIAEGVETESQLDYLCRHGAEYLQGFIFSKPMPKDRFIQFYNVYHREIVNITPRPINENPHALIQNIADAVA